MGILWNFTIKSICEATHIFKISGLIFFAWILLFAFLQAQQAVNISRHSTTAAPPADCLWQLHPDTVEATTNLPQQRKHADMIEYDQRCKTIKNTRHPKVETVIICHYAVCLILFLLFHFGEVLRCKPGRITRYLDILYAPQSLIGWLPSISIVVHAW